MGNKTEAEYRSLKDFFVFFSERYFKLASMQPEERPVARLEMLERRGRKLAFDGLRQAINDCLEMSFHFDHREVEKLDSELRSRGILTLSDLRRRYSRDYARILKQGKIRNETEYYFIHNILGDMFEKTSE